MRRYGICLIAAGAMALCVCGAQAANEKVMEGMGYKAVDGAINVVTGIVEWPMQTYKGYENGFDLIKHKPTSTTVGTILGFFRGIGHSVGRMGWGAQELFGFWTANPEDMKGVGVPFDAKYSWERGTPYSLFKPSFQEGVKPVGMKLAHGVADAVVGIAEVPGQIMLGSEATQEKGKELALGAGRGVWYWWSREFNGFGNVFLCLVPNGEETQGYAYNGEWPWSKLITEPAANAAK